MTCPTKSRKRAGLTRDSTSGSSGHNRACLNSNGCCIKLPKFAHGRRVEGAPSAWNCTPHRGRVLSQWHWRCFWPDCIRGHAPNSEKRQQTLGQLVIASSGLPTVRRRRRRRTPLHQGTGKRFQPCSRNECANRRQKWGEGNPNGSHSKQQIVTPKPDKQHK